SAVPESLLREPEPAVRSAVTHIVRSGETLSGIATRYGVSQASLRTLNRLNSAGAIRAGQRLTIREGSGTASTSAATGTGSSRTHVVKAGETVGAIARRYGVSQSAL